MDTHDIVHALCSDTLVHLLVTIKLVSHRSEQTSSVLTHLLDNVTLPSHHSLEPHVLLPPLLLAEVLAQVTVLVLTVVSWLLLLVSWATPNTMMVRTAVATVANTRALAAGSTIQGVLIVELVVGGGVSLLRLGGRVWLVGRGPAGRGAWGG